ncbi:MAG: AbrB/MazE/SpoVT family DNA-binding domain-containing protein [Chromatiales bacterium]
MMALAHSRLTTQGQFSVPANVSRKLGIGPGAILEWDEDGDRVVVRKAGRYTSGDIHRVVFPTAPRARTIADMKDGIRQDIKRRRASR